jgi:heme-degrading monooxygenase HmoA
MVRATLTMQVRSGREREFELVWTQIAAEVRRVPGNLRQALLRQMGDGAAYVITSDWATEAAFRAFERSAAQDALTAPLRELRESASLVVHQLIDHIDDRR